jgi:hypothetical protein
VPRWPGHGPSKPLSFFDPRVNRAAHVPERYFRGFAIGHAARQVRHAREKTATIIGCERFDETAAFVVESTKAQAISFMESIVWRS